MRAQLITHEACGHSKRAECTVSPSCCRAVELGRAGDKPAQNPDAGERPSVAGAVDGAAHALASLPMRIVDRGVERLG